MSVRVVRPSHPGAFLRSDVLEPLGLSVTGAAEVLGVSRPGLSMVLNGRAALSPEMALRFELAFGVRMETLLRMQMAWDIADARSRQRSVRVRRYKGTAATPAD